METTDPESVLELSDEFQGPVAGEHIGNGVFLTGVSVAVVDLATALEVTADFFQAGPGDLSLTYTVEGASGVYQANVVVPEASSLAMLCTGCLGLLCLTARRRRCGPA